MVHDSKTNNRYPHFRILLSIAMLAALIGALYVPSKVIADDVTDPIIRLSSDDAPACSGEDAASCITTSFKADLAQTASYVFDCTGTDVDLPLLKALALFLGIEIPPYIPLPPTPVPACSLFADGSTFTITDVTEAKNIKEVTYPGRSEDQFAMEEDHVYELSLRAHGRDFRDALEANNWGTFDSFAEVTYQELDPNDDICENAIPFDLPYSGNLEFSGDHDWQRIQSPVKGTMVLTLDVPEGKDYQLEVWSGDCNAVWVGSPHGPGTDKAVEVPVNWGAYHVHVYGKDADDFGEWYGVSATFSGDLDDNQCEKAALFDTLPYTGNLEYSADHDWQRIQSPIIGKMILDLDVPADKDYQMEVWSDDCSSSVWILSGNGTGVDEHFVMPVDAAFYRIHVFGKTPLDFGGSYTVSASFFSDLNDDQWENPYEPPSMPFSGNLEYSGDQDWQRISVPAGGAILMLDVPDGKNYDLELWRNDVKILLAASTNGIGLDEYIPIAQPGTYRVHIYGAGPETDFDAWYSVSLIADNIAPVSAIALTGTAGTNGWYRSNVQVTLSATDNPGGSGVQKIEYGFNYTPWNPFTGPWIAYSNPFTISTEGHTHLEFRSTDSAGNVEPNQSQVIRIDTVAPEISGSIAPPAPNLNGWYNTNVTVGFSATDFQSGIASLIPMETTLTNDGVGQSVTGTAIDNAGNSTSLIMDNINIDKTPPAINIISPQPTSYPHSASLQLAWNAVDPLSGEAYSYAFLDSQMVANGQTIDLFNLSLGSHMVIVIARDNADNLASKVVTFNVTANINSILGLTQRVYNLGWINKQGIYTSLNSSLAAAQASMARNQVNAARNQLMAFLNKLEAQKGKAINLQAYELLKADALYVLNQLPPK